MAQTVSAHIVNSTETELRSFVHRMELGTGNLNRMKRDTNPKVQAFVNKWKPIIMACEDEGHDLWQAEAKSK